tara:strand:+ start:491 stop:1240 length:750 start_codon:yes stop_codon:yes gene_type:complete
MVSFIFAQECDSGYVYIEDVPSCCGAPAEHCFYENDLLVLEKFIENSEETINLLLDNNEDGEMSPLELGFTEWSNGRLVSLDCYLSNIMNCNLSGEIPENIGDLEYLETLWLNGNQLSGEIPESIGNLMNIELLYLSENNFTGSIPASICNLNIDFDGENNWGVEYFNIWGNDLCPPNPDCLSADIVGAQNCIDYSGDLNLDGEINILDIVFIANIILDYNQYISEADINQDNEINILDVITLAAMILD